MKTFLRKLFFVALLVFTFLKTESQTIRYLKVADKAEYAKYAEYCLTGVHRTFFMKGEVSLLLINGHYSQPETGAWVAKYPLVIKWYPIHEKITNSNNYQQTIVASFDVVVPRRYPISIDDFYKYWKTGLIQSGYIDSKSTAVYDFMK